MEYVYMSLTIFFAISDVILIHLLSYNIYVILFFRVKIMLCFWEKNFQAICN